MPYCNAADIRAGARDAWHSEWISKHGLKARLWTNKAIAKFPGKPQKAGPIMARKRKAVLKAERSLAFQNWLAKRREWLVAHGRLPAEQKPGASSDVQVIQPGRHATKCYTHQNATCFGFPGYNNRRFLERLGHIPPVEAEKTYYASIGNGAMAA